MHDSTIASGAAWRLRARSRVARSVVQWHDGFDALAAEWETLADEVSASPFLCPAWFEAWWAAFGSGRPTVAIVRRHGSIVALAPLVRRYGAVAAPVNWHSMEFGMLAADATAREQLIRGLVGTRARRIDLGFLAADGEDARVFQAAAADGGRRLIARTLAPFHSVAVEGTWEQFHAGLSKNRRGDLRRCRRRLEELGAVELTLHTELEGVDAAVDEALALEAAGWKGQERSAIASRPETAAFYRAIARWAAKRGWLRLYVLRLDGRAIAFHLVLADGETAHHLKSGFDESLRKLAPGMLLLASCLERAFGDGTRRVVLGKAEPYKTAWPGESTDRVLLQAFAGSLPGRADWAAHAHGRPAAKRVKDRVRDQLARRS